MATATLSASKILDARCAMGALVQGRCLSFREDEPEYPQAVAQLAWDIAEAMAAEHARRANEKGRGK